MVKARFQNVYGPGEILGAGQWRGTSATVWRNVIPTFLYRALKRMPLKAPFLKSLSMMWRSSLAPPMKKVEPVA